MDRPPVHELSAVNCHSLRFKCRATASSFQAVGVVIGFRNWSTASRRWRSSSSKLNHNDKGSVRWHSGAMNRARGGFPEGAADKIIQPPLAPTFTVCESICNASRIRRTRPGFRPWIITVTNDHQARIDPAAEETHRFRGSPSPAIFLGATKAIASVPLRTTARFTIVIGTMELPAAKKTALLTSLLGQIRIDFLQQ